MRFLKKNLNQYFGTHLTVAHKVYSFSFKLAVIEQEVVCTLDWSPVHHRATQRQTTIHTHA